MALLLIKVGKQARRRYNFIANPQFRTVAYCMSCTDDDSGRYDRSFRCYSTSVLQVPIVDGFLSMKRWIVTAETRIIYRYMYFV